MLTLVLHSATPRRRLGLTLGYEDREYEKQEYGREPCECPRRPQRTDTTMHFVPFGDEHSCGRVEISLSAQKTQNQKLEETHDHHHAQTVVVAFA
jgi:hypothetical protein